MEQVALGSSLNELYFGTLTVQNGSAELPVALKLYYGGSIWSDKSTPLRGVARMVALLTIHPIIILTE